MTDQEQFDTAVRGVLAQGGPAINHNGSCLYRTPDGKKCAFGHLIPDDKYKSEMEGLTARSVIEDFDLGTSYNADLVGRLQRAHDNASMNGSFFLKIFKDKAREIANRFNLDPSCLEA